MYKFTTFALLGIALLLGAMLFFKTCDKESPIVVGTTVTTVPVVFRDTTNNVPVPTKRTEVDNLAERMAQYARRIRGRDTVEIGYVLEVDTSAILRDFFATNLYSDTHRVSTGRVNGYFVTNDTITENQIKGRGVIQHLIYDSVTKTITIALPKKLALYFGLAASSNGIDPFYAAGPSLTFKFKNDNLISAKALYNRDNKWMFQAGVDFKIKLKK